MPVSERGATRYLRASDYANAPRPIRARPARAEGINRPVHHSGFFSDPDVQQRERFYRRQADLREQARRDIAAMRKLDRKLKALGVAKQLRQSLFSKSLTGRIPWDSIGDFADLLDRGQPGPRLHHGSWAFSGQCTTGIPLNPQSNVSAGITCINSLTTSAYPTAGWAVGWTYPASTVRYLHHNVLVPRANPAIADNRTRQRYENLRAPQTSMPGRWYMPEPEPWTDPNVQRAQPSLRPAPSPQEMYDFDTAVQEQTEAALNRLPPSQTRTFEQTAYRVSRPLRQPPRGRSRERKFLSKSMQLLIALFKGLDSLSEVSELVDAFYDALPKHIKDAWKQKSRGLLDNAGQYGIDGADWKLQALYHNWKSVDPQKAVKNVVNNHLQDQLLGAAHKNLPRNEGNAFEEGFKALNGLYQSGWSQVVG